MRLMRFSGVMVSVKVGMVVLLAVWGGRRLSK